MNIHQIKIVKEVILRDQNHKNQVLKNLSEN